MDLSNLHRFYFLIYRPCINTIEARFKIIFSSFGMKREDTWMRPEKSLIYDIHHPDKLPAHIPNLYQ